MVARMFGRGGGKGGDKAFNRRGAVRCADSIVRVHLGPHCQTGVHLMLLGVEGWDRGREGICRESIGVFFIVFP